MSFGFGMMDALAGKRGMTKLGDLVALATSSRTKRGFSLSGAQISSPASALFSTFCPWLLTCTRDLQTQKVTSGKSKNHSCRLVPLECLP